jgi:hypothetical protein
MGSSRRCVSPGRNWVTFYGGGDCSTRIPNRGSRYVCPLLRWLLWLWRSTRLCRPLPLLHAVHIIHFPSLPGCVFTYYCTAYDDRIIATEEDNNYEIVICFSLLFSKLFDLCFLNILCIFVVLFCVFVFKFVYSVFCILFRILYTAVCLSVSYFGASLPTASNRWKPNCCK